MSTLIRLVFAIIRHIITSRADLLLENLALRQQLAMFERSHGRPKIADTDRAFWVALKDHLDHWVSILVVVKPSTVIRWHRQGFRTFWRWKSRGRRPGRPTLSLDTRRLIRRMATDNRWRAPRIARELGRLGIDVHADTVRRHMPRIPPTEAQRQSWINFLRNHRESIAAMDFFTIPTATFRLLYGFHIIHHGRRQILRFNVTFHPSAAWVIQQLREAFPFDEAPKYLLFDNDKIFSVAVLDAIRSMGIRPTRTAYRSPWQNPVGERWIGTFRRELLDHIVVLNEQHLRRLGNAYISYYNADRCHTTLHDDSPEGRPVSPRPSRDSKVVATRRAGGLHHRYDWRVAA